jgi:signal transduction histidine kinase
MNSNHIRFPFFYFFVSLFAFVSSCNVKEPNKESGNYNELIEKAGKLKDANKLDSAFYLYNEAKLQCKDSELDKKVFSLIQMCAIQHIICDFSGSEETATEALLYVKNSDYKPNVYNQLGISYLEQFDYDNAIKYYKKSLKETDYWLFEDIILNNIGVVYLEAKQYNKAVQVLRPISKSDSLPKQPMYYAKVLDNLGFALFKLKNPDGIQFLNKALTIRDSLQDNYESIASYIHLTEYYQNSNKNLSIQFAERSYNAAEKVNSTDDKLEALQFLISNSNAEESKKWATIYIHLSDSINKVRKIAKNEFSKIKYDSKKAISEKNRYQKVSANLFRISIILIIVFVFIFVVIRKKNKQKLTQNTYNTESRISKKLHDELANDVYHTLTFVETQNLENVEKKEILLSKLDKIYERTRNISKDNSTIETGEKFAENFREMIANYNSESIKVILSDFNEINWSKLNKEKKIIIYRVIHELLVNMKKHSQCNLVVLQFKSAKKRLEISYSDNGVGFNKVNLKKNGLQNAVNRIETIKGTITFDGITGFKCKISVPI